ncbi:MAG: stage II sporulation protein M [Candidatus Bathyarchaeota archaeon]|nr:stage II sporulation protein M [Candidatus Bathyarchaeum sp.]
MLLLRIKLQFLKAIKAIKDAVNRNSLIVKSVSLAFFIVLVVAIVVAITVFYVSPELSDSLSSLTQSLFSFDDLPSAYNLEFLSYIFLNNSGHFWNPIRMIVWIPVLGPVVLALEIILNSGVIGAVAVIAGINNGVAYPIIGLVPHGIIEIPAFLLQLSAIVLWQATITEAILAKLRGKQVDRQRAKQGLKDTIILAVVSVVLLFVAAVIETYVTPYLLGM